MQIVLSFFVVMHFKMSSSEVWENDRNCSYAELKLSFQAHRVIVLVGELNIAVLNYIFSLKNREF